MAASVVKCPVWLIAVFKTLSLLRLSLCVHLHVCAYPRDPLAAHMMPQEPQKSLPKSPCRDSQAMMGPFRCTKTEPR